MSVSISWILKRIRLEDFLLSSSIALSFDSQNVGWGDLSSLFFFKSTVVLAVP